MGQPLKRSNAPGQRRTAVIIRAHCIVRVRLLMPYFGTPTIGAFATVDNLPRSLNTNRLGFQWRNEGNYDCNNCGINRRYVNFSWLCLYDLVWRKIRPDKRKRTVVKPEFDLGWSYWTIGISYYLFYYYWQHTFNL